MAKGTILDRLAGAMKTLGKREGKSMTPRQRVAAAQRWNSLADIGENRLDEYRDTFGRDFLARDRRHAVKNGLDNADYGDELWGLMDLGLVGEHSQRADNPFLSDNIDKYREQSEFLDWCHYNRLEPNARTLKQFRWETYQTLPYRERQWIANKDAVRNYMRDNYTLYGQQPPELKTLRDTDEYWTKNVWNGVEPREGYLEYAYPKRQPYSSIEEFPNDFDYMWRY